MTVAQKVIEKCGGVAKTAELAGASVNWVYRWQYPRENGGTGGKVPRKAQENLLKAAASGAVDLTPADFFEAA